MNSTRLFRLCAKGNCIGFVSETLQAAKPPILLIWPIDPLAEPPINRDTGNEQNTHTKNLIKIAIKVEYLKHLTLSSKQLTQRKIAQFQAVVIGLFPPQLKYIRKQFSFVDSDSFFWVDDSDFYFGNERICHTFESFTYIHLNPIYQRVVFRFFERVNKIKHVRMRF